MENIHVLPTEKESKLYKRNDLKTYYLGDFALCEVGDNLRTNQNIYITSDEGVKERDWCLNEDDFDKHLLFKADSLFFDTGLEAKKIILTTDKDLIKDGVQAIDDDFLEWFVKNPSCESVEVVYEPINFLDTKQGWEYTIIIPKEEPKQETLEEAAANYLHRVADGKRTTGYSDEDFIEGAKWQQEPEQFFNDDRVKTLEKAIEYLLKKQEQDKNKFSEKEVLEILNEFSVACYSPIEKFEIPEWFKKFKKK